MGNLTQQLSKLRLTSDTFDRGYFASDEYHTENLIAKAAEPVIKGRKQPSPDHAISQLLQTFRKLDAQLGQLAINVATTCSTSRDEVSADAAAYIARIDSAEREIATLQESLRALDSRADGLASFSSRLGSRLVTADNQRQRALFAASALQHLNAFAHSKDLSTLPSMFTDDSRMEEAAVVVAKLSAAVGKILNGRDTGNNNTHSGNTLGGRSSTCLPEPGSLQNAAEQLELYRNVLDNRVVSRFDAALQEQDFPKMAECVVVMAAAGGDKGVTLLISRYISTRPLFTDVATLNAAVGAAAASASSIEVPTSSTIKNDETKRGQQQPGDALLATTALSAVRSLSDLYRVLSTFLRDEAFVLDQVFPDAYHALAVLVHRVFEQIVHTALSTVLSPTPVPGAGSDALRAHLRLLAESYRKTLALAEEAVELAGPGAGLSAVDLVDAGCGTALAEYLRLELEWLSTLGGAKLADAKRTLSRDLLLDLISMNEEALKRCVQVSPSVEVAGAVRQLFYCEQDSAARAPGCLLGQAAAHVLLGLTGAADRCVRRLAGAFKPSQASASEQQAADADAAASLGTLLRAIADVAGIVACLQQHYDRTVRPHVDTSPTEAAACEQGLAQLVAAVDACIGVALQRTLDRLFRRVAATLATEQSKSDFRPSEFHASSSFAHNAHNAHNALAESGEGGDKRSLHSTAANALDRPTAACCAIVALLGAMGQQAAAHLHGSNLSAFLSEFSRRTAAAVEAHALKFTYSPEGALRWRRDIGEYAACMARLGARGGAPAFEDLENLASLLIVVPESLPGLLDGMLYLDRRRLAKVIERREDYKTARVGNKPLSAFLA